MDFSRIVLFPWVFSWSQLILVDPLLALGGYSDPFIHTSSLEAESFLISVFYQNLLLMENNEPTD